MIKATIKFFGAENDEYGMPIPYRSYFVVSSPWNAPDSGIADVIPLTTDPICPNPQRKIVMAGGERNALDEMLKILRELPENKNLTELLDLDS